MYLRDSLLRLAAADLFSPAWSSQILAELRRALLREQAATPDQADRIIVLMQAHFPNAETFGFEPLIPAMTCDEKDRHVLAAAVRSGATVLVTANLDDFPRSATQAQGVEVQSPDDFLLDLLDLAPAIVLRTLSEQAQRYKREPTTLNGLLVALSRAGAEGFADEVRRLTA
jgi:predicted nucleic acid-binding protein